ncbi:MAG: molybdopterin-dependent oxidoreductase [Deltaproteobacteria bacterium]|nr:molybdopterin-dependent oxidoreductase [Deltaproteobacteria bacterium]
MGSTEAKGYRQIVTILNDHPGEEWTQGTLTDFEKAEVILVIGGGAVELHPVLKPMINTFLKKDGGELVVISSWRDYLLERATLPIEIRPESQEIFLSELRESLSGNIECRQSDVGEFGVDCSALVRLVSLLDGEKEILLLVAPYLFGDNEQLGQLAAYLSDRLGAILPLGAQCNSRGAMFQSGFSSILQPGGMPVEKSKRGFKHTDEIFKAIENGTIRALYLLGDDPLENSPDPERIKDLLKKLDLLIYQSPYEGASASLADIVFPSATIPEKSGSVVSVFGNQKNINPVIAMPDGVKTDLRILRELVDAMGDDGKEFAIDTIQRRLLEQVHTVRDEAISEHHDSPGEHAWKKEEDVMTKSPDFPYIMIPVPSLFGDGVVSRNSPQLNELRNGIKVLMSPGDFEEHSFEKNELVEIVSRFGSARSRIECSASVQRGTVLASNMPGSSRGLLLLKKQHRIIPVNIVRIKENGR